MNLYLPSKKYTNLFCREDASRFFKRSGLPSSVALPDTTAVVQGLTVASEKMSRPIKCAFIIYIILSET
jgi:hypothetical protein